MPAGWSPEVAVSGVGGMRLARGVAGRGLMVVRAGGG